MAVSKMLFIDIGSDEFVRTQDASQIHADEEIILQKCQERMTHRPALTLKRISSRGRLTAYERVAALCDEGAPIWYIGALEFFEESPEKSSGLGVICALASVQHLSCIIIANDNTVSAGSWWPGTPEKIQRAQNMALRLHIPVIYLVECAGLYLPHQDKTFAGHDGAGAIFRMQAKLNQAGIIQLGAVFGDCIAGGGYLPLLCHKIVMTEQASICIGGTALNQNACGGGACYLGGPDVHVHHSRCADARVHDDMSALAWLKDQMSLLPNSANGFYRISESFDSPYEVNDLYQIIPRDISLPYDIHEVIARLVDGAQIHPIMEDMGKEIISCVCMLDGLPCIILANCTQTNEDGHAGSILYRDGLVKMRKVCTCARDDGLPVIWIQDVSGFEIGEEAERDGLLRYGSSLLYEISHDSPMASMTVILRKASGAGYYAMHGMPFEPGWAVMTAISRLEVMHPAILASTLYDKKIQSSAAESSERRALETSKAQTIAHQMESSRAESVLSRGDVDTFVPLYDLRRAMISFIHAVYQSAGGPVKPFRLWSVLDEGI